MAIQYKPQDINPQGKQRVYFTCHPADFDLYFEFLTDMLRKRHNCVIWYYGKAENGIVEQSDLENLDQMQLFVIPITYRFLTEPNRALDAEFRYAVEHHIPVLPIMMGSGLDELFMQKCGSLQYLDPNAKDETAISFDEKLDRFLNSVLVGDEVAVKIRAAFDAYIFMSYRKKDRKHAQELMRLIHRNPYCRDIAIWYDEYLTAGRNFNQEISEALEKSALFALVVTPHLLEMNPETGEPNYVAKIEYPNAVESGKDILPVEMVDTDRTGLQKMYPDIPGVVSGHEDSMLTESLLSAVQRLAITENDNSPEHNFFIGLAYLGGIDVEVDHERAIHLITGAAEQNLEEAIIKLIQMYQTGEGVEWNYAESIKWRKRLVELAEKEYNNNQTEENFLRLINRLWDWGDDEYTLRHLPEAADAYQKMLDYCLMARDTKKYSRVHRQTAVSYSKLGTIKKELRQYEKARSYYEINLDISLKLLKENPTPMAKRDVALAYSYLGEVEEALSDYVKARSYYEKSMEIREELLRAQPTPEAKRDVGIVYNDLGRIEETLQDYTKARIYFEKSFAIGEELLKEKPTPETRRNVSVSYSKLGIIEEALQNYEEARNYYEKSLAILQELLREQPTPEAKRDVSVLYEKLGKIESALQNYEEARSYFEKSLAIREGLLREQPTPGAKQDVMISYNKLGAVEEALLEYEEACSYYEKETVIAEELIKEHSTPEEKLELSITYDKLGIIEYALQEYAKAQCHYERSLAIREEMLKEHPTPEAKRAIAASYSKLGHLAETKEEFDLAYEYYAKCLEITKELNEQYPTPQHKSDLERSTEAYNRVVPKLGLIKRFLKRH